MAHITLAFGEYIRAILNPDDIDHITWDDEEKNRHGFSTPNIKVYRKNNPTPLKIYGTQKQVDSMMQVLEEELKSLTP